MAALSTIAAPDANCHKCHGSRDPSVELVHSSRVAPNGALLEMEMAAGGPRSTRACSMARDEG